MTDFGMPTLLELQSLEETAALCRELRLQFIELNMNLPQYQPDALDIEQLQAIAREYGVYYTIHLDENLNVSDFNPYVAEAYRRTVRETIRLAKELRAPVLNMHLARGVYFTLPAKKVYLFAAHKDQYLKSMRDFRDEADTAIGDADLQICVENSDGFTDFQVKALDLLLQSPVFGLTFDIGHDHGIGGTDEPILTERVERLHHVHCHDALGRKNHLTLGTGELDLPKYLTLARAHNCRVVLETKTVEALRQSVAWLDQNGFRT